MFIHVYECRYDMGSLTQDKTKCQGSLVGHSSCWSDTDYYNRACDLKSVAMPVIVVIDPGMCT